MRRQLLLLGSAVIVSSACPSSTVPPISLPTPSTPEIGNPDVSTLSHLRLTPGVHRYRLSQTTEAAGDGATDTIPGTVTTTAAIQVTVRNETDSTFLVTISFDSIAISGGGAVPTRGIRHPTVLDSVVRARFSPSHNTVESHLPDSLCAYSQFTAVGRQLLLPELLSGPVASTRAVLRDTTTYHSCRAGTRIGGRTIRESRTRPGNSGQLEITQETELHGAGLLRRDSVLVRGSITTRGTVSFESTDRLPAFVQTQSDGTIEVRLGSSVTTFRQRSSQEIRRVGAQP